jgi:hypothetical protein
MMFYGKNFGSVRVVSIVLRRRLLALRVSVKCQDNISRWKGGKRGYDAGKGVKGRKRHLIVDTLGFLLAVVIRSDIDERKGAAFVLARLNKFRADYPYLKVS